MVFGFGKKKKDVNKDAEAPEETKVGCCNTLSRSMGCCDLTSSDGPPNLRQGVLKKRSCTDLPWLAIFIVFHIILLTVIWLPAFDNADADRFTGSSDFLKNTCGQSDGFEGYDYAFWPDLTVFEVKVCVQDCDETNVASTYGGDSSMIYESDDKLFWCIPDEDAAGYSTWFKKFEDYRFINYMMDLYDNYQIPLVAIPFTFLFLTLFFILVWWCLKMVFRILYFGILLGTFIGAYCFMQDGKDVDEASYYTGVTILIIGLTLWCILMMCWSKLMKILTVLEKASKALMIMPQLLTVPIITFPFVMGVVILWYIVCLMMFSTGGYTEHAVPSSDAIEAVLDEVESDLNSPYYGQENDAYFKTEYDTSNQQNTFFIHLFWMLWAIKFIEYFNFLVISGCVADWYLDKCLIDNPEANEEFNKGRCGGNCTRIFGALKRVILYHFGTIAFASCLIAIIQTIEAILMYVKKQMGDTTNPFAKMILKITMAVIKCIECIMDRCNKSTLVVTAVLGVPFCAGCGKSLQLFFNNMATMTLGTGMIILMCYLANFCIASLSAGAAGFMVMGIDTKEDMYSMMMPLFVAFMVSFFIAKLMLSVWDCAATTILVCTCMLDEWYKGEWGEKIRKQADVVEKGAKGDDESQADEIELQVEKDVNVKNEEEAV